MQWLNQYVIFCSIPRFDRPALSWDNFLCLSANARYERVDTICSTDFADHIMPLFLFSVISRLSIAEYWLFSNICCATFWIPTSRTHIKQSRETSVTHFITFFITLFYFYIVCILCFVLQEQTTHSYLLLPTQNNAAQVDYMWI